MRDRAGEFFQPCENPSACQKVWCNQSFEEEMGNYTATSARVKRMKKVMGYGEHRIVELDTCVSDMAVFGAEQLFRGIL